MFHHDKATAHKLIIAIEKNLRITLRITWNLPYSPDMAPSDYHLFLNLKIYLDGWRIQSNEEIVATVNNCFEKLDESRYRNAEIKLEQRYDKFIFLSNGYVEK